MIKNVYNILFRLYNAVYKQNTIEKLTKVCILPFPKKGDLGISKNYKGISLPATTEKVYDELVHNRIQSEIKIILRKKQNGLRRNRFTIPQILTIRWMIEGLRAKNIEATLIYVVFFKTFDSIQREVGANTTSIWSSQRNCYRYNDVLQKHESCGSLTWWRHRLLRYYLWSLARSYIRTIFVCLDNALWR